jgi:comEA protein
MIRTWIAVGACAAVCLAVAGQRPVDALQAQAAASEARAPQVNLNTASAGELEKLPGVGPATAQRIIEYRQKNGGFKKIEDLMNVRGIGEASFLKLKPQITVAPVRTAER